MSVHFFSFSFLFALSIQLTVSCRLEEIDMIFASGRLHHPGSGTSIEKMYTTDLVEHAEKLEEERIETL